MTVTSGPTHGSHSTMPQAPVVPGPEARALRDAGQPTLPATLASERACNPFLRSAAPAVRDSIEAHIGRTLGDDIDAFAELRRWKDGFRA